MSSGDHEDAYRDDRERMVRDQIERRGVRDPKVLRALRETPRHRFVPRELWSEAYDDRPLPIGYGQTISQPYIVAYMTEALKLKGGERVLEIGTGSGYQAALLSRIAGEVFTIERVPELVEWARQRFDELGYGNIHCLQADGTRGWDSMAPFQGIMVTAGGPHIPRPLTEQLDLGGVLVMPVGRNELSQTLVRVTRSLDGEFQEETLMGVAFVPLIGEHGWRGGERGF